MVALLMLGIIPGTNFEITFAGWLRFVVVLAMLTTIYLALRRGRLLAILIAMTIRSASRRVKPTALPA